MAVILEKKASVESATALKARLEEPLASICDRHRLTLTDTDDGWTATSPGVSGKLMIRATGSGSEVEVRVELGFLHSILIGQVRTKIREMLAEIA